MAKGSPGCALRLPHINTRRYYSVLFASFLSFVSAFVLVLLAFPHQVYRKEQIPKSRQIGSFLWIDRSWISY